MGAEKRHSGTPSLSRCSSFLNCFNGGEEPYEPIISSSTEAQIMTRPNSKKTRRPTLQLGSKRGPPKRSVSFSCASTKVRQACEQALEVAKKGTPHISELFVGGQLFMQVAPAKFGPPKPPTKQAFSPSLGFLHMTPIMQTSLHER